MIANLGRLIYCAVRFPYFRFYPVVRIEVNPISVKFRLPEQHEWSEYDWDDDYGIDHHVPWNRRGWIAQFGTEWRDFWIGGIPPRDDIPF